MLDNTFHSSGTPHPFHIDDNETLPSNIPVSSSSTSTSINNQPVLPSPSSAISDSSIPNHMSTPIPGSIESIHRSEYHTVNPIYHSHPLSPSLHHPLSPEPNPVNNFDNTSNQSSTAPLSSDPALNRPPLDSLSQPQSSLQPQTLPVHTTHQSIDSNSQISNTSHSPSVTFHTNSSDSSISNEYNERSLEGSTTGSFLGNNEVSTSGQKNNVVFSDTIGTKLKSMPSNHSSGKHRASFAGFHGKQGIMNPLKSVTALGALITSSSNTNSSNSPKPIKEKHPKRPSLWIPDSNNIGKPVRSSRSKSYGTALQRSSPFSESYGIGNYESNEEGFNPNNTSFVNDQRREHQPYHPHEPRKGNGITQSGINVIKMPFRKLRKHSGNRENDDEITSDSDPENGTGDHGAQKSNRYPNSKQQRILKIDLSSLQPPPSHFRAASNPNYHESPRATIPAHAMQYGFVTLASGNSGSSIPTTPMTEELPKESSATRFKDLIRRNVGISSSSPAPSSINSSTSTTPSAAGKGGYQPWGAIGDLLSTGADQQTSLVSRLKKGGRKKSSKDGGIGTGVVGAGLLGAMAGTSRGTKQDTEPANQSDDSHVVLTIMRECPNRYHFREFMQHIDQPKLEEGPDCNLDSIVIGEFAELGINMTKKKQCTLISRALAEARQSNKDPNVLVAELMPLPPDFKEAFTWLSTPHPPNDTLHTPCVSSVVTASSMPIQSPVAASLHPGPKSYNTFSVPGRTGVIYATTMPPHPRAGSGSQITIQYPGTMPTSPGAVVHGPDITKKYQPDLRVFSPKMFLFKSYQNAKFHGHYVFRIQGDTLEYGRIPASKDTACSHYFREADKIYRAIELKDKKFRDERMLASIKREQEFEDVRAAEIIMCQARALAETYETESDAEITNDLSSNDPNHNGLQFDIEKPSQLSNGDTGSEITQKTRNQDSLRTTRSSDSTFHEGDSSGFTSYNSSTSSPASSFTASTPIDSYFDMEDRNDRYEEVKQTRARSISLVGLEQPKFDNSPTRTRHRSVAAAFECSRKSTCSTAEILWHNSDITPEHERKETMLRAIDKAYWDKIEQKNHLESVAQIHGTTKCLLYLTEGLEFQEFEKVVDVEIVKASKDVNTKLFSILNADKTNLMWLESPSFKQRGEFLNLMAISLMDNEDEERDVSHVESRRRRNPMIFLDYPYLNDVNDNGCSTLHKCSEKDAIDCLIYMSDVRLALYQEKIRNKRLETEKTIRQLEELLEKFDELDDNARKLAYSLINILDKSNLRDLLQPSPATGLTLAQTVETKVRDVNERIVVCARIMNAARLNVNRLEYEIELEQRSIRLFRQYKIGIAISTILALCFLWLLYDNRSHITMFVPPMSSVPLSPLEEASLNLKTSVVPKNQNPQNPFTCSLKRPE